MDETRESDLLLHVIDVSHPQFEDQIQVVTGTLAEIGSDDKPVILVFNKMDKLEEEPFGPTRLDQINGIRDRFEALGHEVIFLSAIEKTGVDTLKDFLYQKVKEIHVKRYPYHQFLY